MVSLIDVIVSFWFLPVLLFIVLPLLMLCGWLLLRLAAPQQARRMHGEKIDLTDAAAIRKGS